MKNPSYFLTGRRSNLDYRVWATMLVGAAIFAVIAAFKIIKTPTCQEFSIVANGRNFEQTKTLFINQPIAFSIAGITGERVVAWDFGDNTSHDGINTVAHAYNAAGNYIVTATIDHNCRATFQVHVAALPTVDIHDTISNPIQGIDAPKAGEMVSYFSSLQGSSYEWKILNDLESAGSKNNSFSHTFLLPGTYTVQLMLNGDPSKVYKKMVMVQGVTPTTSAAPAPMPLPGPSPVPVRIPEPVKVDVPEKKEEAVAVTEDPAPKKKKAMIVPDEEFLSLLRQVGDKKKTVMDFKDYLCDDYASTKVQENGKILTLQQLCDKLQDKKGLFGVGGKPKIKSVRISRDPETNCVILIYVELK